VTFGLRRFVSHEPCYHHGTRSGGEITDGQDVAVFALPVWAPKPIFVIPAVGAISALIFAWAFEITPEGLKKEADLDRSKSVPARPAAK